jgi:hypothetical protein
MKIDIILNDFLCLAQTSLVIGLKQGKLLQSLPPEVLPANVAFVEDNAGRLSEMQQRWQALDGS